MNRSKTHKLFISHSWNWSSNEYEELVSYLNEYPNFYWEDYSSSKENPVTTSISWEDGSFEHDWHLFDKLEERMEPCTCFLMFVGKHSALSQWRNVEVAIANKLHKPMICIELEKNGMQMTPTIIQDINRPGHPYYENKPNYHLTGVIQLVSSTTGWRSPAIIKMIEASCYW